MRDTSAPIVMLEPKHRRPRLREGLVARDRLVRRLAGSSDVPLALVIAPGGYGKTTILSQWADQDARPFAWLTVDDDDNDPRRLIASIAAVLDEIEPVDSRFREQLEAPQPKLADLLSGLARSLQSRTGAFVLVLDDVHAIRSEKSLSTLAAIVDRLPSGSRLALGSRHEPRMPVGRLRANRNVVELRPRDLVMTSSESAALLRLAGVELDERLVETIVQRAEGWPVALYLAALSIRESPDRATAATWFGGHDRLISDYLRDEVLSGLTPDRAAFLRRAALLDRLSGPLCDAVLERADSARVLAELERSNVLVFPADGGHYRYHGLLSQMLRVELRRLEPALESQLHGRAAARYAGRGDVDSAIPHAISARDLMLAGELLWSNLLSYASYGRAARLRGWLDRFTDEETAAVPALALATAGDQLARGDVNLADHWISTATRRLRELGPPAVPSLEGGVAVLRAAAGTEGLARTLEHATHAYQLLAEDDPWRSLCCLLIGVARHLTGAGPGARVWLEEGARRGAVWAPRIQALCLAQHALLALDSEDGANAHVYATRARTQIERLGALDHPTSALVLAVSASDHARAGRVDEAKIDGRRAAELAAELADFAPWYEIEIRTLLARTALRLSDIAGARGQLTHASRLLRHAPGAPVLHDWVVDLRTRADAAAGRLNGHSWSLTTAELRVLQFLPTHLSVPEIAVQLNVSANTVKTHTRAVYRKLDASSRAQAVARARGAGLVDANLALAAAA
jgi:LuxR family maltose regulon positive regulatory protein